MTPSPSPQHQRILANLNDIVAMAPLTHRRVYPISECTPKSTGAGSAGRYARRRGRLSLVSARGIEGAPTLVVEILSPSTTLIDRSTKRQLYARHGVPYYWIVDPEARTVEAYLLAEGGYQPAARAAGSDPVSLPPFPDLAFAPTSLWP